MWSEETHSLLLHRTPGKKTVSIGIWIAHGGAHDPADAAGSTHLVEHLTLRRCGGRERLELARLLDRLGGEVDAWTSAESMGLSIQTTLDALPEALGVLRDAVMEPTFLEEDVRLECQVALAEYRLSRDDPADRVGEAILQAAWGDHPLARSIVGTPESIALLGPALLEEHHRIRMLRPDRLIVAAVGDLDTAILEETLEGLPLGGSVSRPRLSAPQWHAEKIEIDGMGAEQVHVRLAFPGVPAAHPDAVLFQVLARILGGGNSSRLFQKLREDEGLCYDIWATPVLRSTAGLIEVGWASSAASAPRCMELVLEEIGRLHERLETVEIATAVEGLRRALLMDSETPQGRASLDIGEILERNRRFDLQAVQAELDAVDLDRLLDAAREFLRPEIMASAICRA